MVAPLVTQRLIRSYIEEGRGIGHGERYRAFIQLQRWNASPVSVQTVGHVPPFTRRMHFLSRSEWLLSLLFAWIGGHVREQFPMWPWRSPGPLFGLNPDLDLHLIESPGTVELCRVAGIPHGCFVDTNIPYIWTLDLVVTLAWLPPPSVSAVVVSVKPLESEQYTGDIDPISRGPEKLEIERQYSLGLTHRYFVADRTLYPGHLLGQLEFYSRAAYLPRNHHVETARNRFLDRHADGLSQQPPIEWRDRLVADHKLEIQEADFAVQNIIWNQLVDVDLQREIQGDRLVRSGGRALQMQIRKNLEGRLN